jgi:hypothetical protein
MEELRDHNRGALFQDEWAQYIKRMDGQSYAEEMKEYLLRLYDNKPIARRTAKATIEVDDPALVIVGTTVEDTFLKNVSLESMLDGFSQRFQYVIGREDPARTPDMFPIYRTMEPDNLLPVQLAWAALECVPLHAQYNVDKAGEQEFVQAFQRMFDHYRSIPASFFRRVMWRTFKYALVYHLLLGKHSDTIDAEDIGWAARASAFHLKDARRLLDSYNMTELERIVRAAEALQARLGRKPKARELISGIRAITNRSMADFVLQLMGAPAAAPVALAA